MLSRLSPALSRALFHTPVNGYTALIEPLDTQQHLAMLRILYAAASTALDTFHAAANPVDAQLLGLLEKMVERTELEIERLAAHLANPS
jgi:hypothetical protein